MLKARNTVFFNELFGKLNQHQLCYAYSGNFTEDLTQHILSLAETGLEAESESVQTKKKVYFIMVESLQNITQHQGDANERLKDGFFCIDKYKGGYQVTSGNIVDDLHIAELRFKLDKVNSLDGVQLKAYCQEILSEGSFSDKGGAGLGLIEIARKSGNKLVYDFVPLSKGFSYFYFQSNIADKNAPQPLDLLLDSAANLAIAKDIHTAISENNLKLFYHGLFGHENLKSLLKMTAGSTFENENVTFKKTSMALMIELLQNICFHGVSKNNNSDEKPGIFMVADSAENCSLLSGNYIKNSCVEKISNRIQELNAMGLKELNRLFLDVLLKETQENTRGAGLGFIDVRLKTGNPIEMDITPYSEELSFLLIKTTINYQNNETN
ncbi:MAG: hypothetical protein IPP32_06175 [Bacteroidetes bacterium]|nr:hypothetical protein [Bacteroidota bacterium]